MSKAKSQVATEVQASMKVPVALLPFEEKAKLIVELKRQGKTYREIQKALKVSPRDVKRALKLEVRRDDIEELKGRMGEFDARLSNIEKALAELRGFQRIGSRASRMSWVRKLKKWYKSEEVANVKKELSFLVGRTVSCPYCRDRRARIVGFTEVLGARARIELCVRLECDSPKHVFFVNLRRLAESAYWDLIKLKP